MKISVVMPVYNEAATIEKITERVLENLQGGELIIVDDYSTDGTRDKLKTLEKNSHIRVIYQDKNRGKGAALRAGFEHVRGDVIIIQDADLEYDPREYAALLAPIRDGRADVVYGSRFLGGPHRVLYYWHFVGNQLLTLLSNVLSNVNLSDMETCYKVFTKEVLQKLSFKSDRFGFEPEFTMKVAKNHFRIYEMPISYSGRSYSEGKKIGWKDGVEAIVTMIRYRFFD